MFPVQVLRTASLQPGSMNTETKEHDRDTWPFANQIEFRHNMPRFNFVEVQVPAIFQRYRLKWPKIGTVHRSGDEPC